MTGPELYQQGLKHLKNAQGEYGELVDAALAQACFTGAQAAALGGLAAEESKSLALREAWSAAIGDTANGATK